MGNDKAMDFFDALSEKKSLAAIGECIANGLHSVAEFLVAEHIESELSMDDVERQVQDFMKDYVSTNSHIKLTELDLKEVEVDFREVLLDTSEVGADGAIQVSMAAAFIVAWSLSLVKWETAEHQLEKGKVLKAISKRDLGNVAVEVLSSLVCPADDRIQLAQTQIDQSRRLLSKLMVST